MSQTNSDWQEKYYTCVADNEQQQLRYEDALSVMRHGVAVLCLGVGSQDSRLQQQAAEIRQAINSETNQAELNKLITNFGEQLRKSQLESDPSDKGEIKLAVQHIISMAQSLPLSRNAKQRLAALTQQLEKNGVKALADVIEQSGEIFVAALQNQPKQVQKKQASWQRWLKQLIKLPGHFGWFAHQKQRFCKDMDSVTLPLMHQQQAKELRDKIAASDNPLQLLDGLNHYLKLLHQLVTIDRENHNQFLSELCQRFDSMQAFISKLEKHQATQKDTTQQIQSELHHDLTELKNSTEQASDLNELKRLIDKQLNKAFKELAQFYQQHQAQQKEHQLDLTHLQERVREAELNTEQVLSVMSQKLASAERDALTKLPNRSAYDERMGQVYSRAMRFSDPLALLVMDIDNFKQINDNYGHQAGDKVLVKVAELLSASLRKIDFVCRYGGEEFLVILEKHDAQTALVVADKLRGVIEKCQFHFSGQPVDVTLSVGIAELSSNDTPDSLFAHADKALYAAKKSGKNCCLCHQP